MYRPLTVASSYSVPLILPSRAGEPSLAAGKDARIEVIVFASALRSLTVRSGSCRNVSFGSPEAFCHDGLASVSVAFAGGVIPGAVATAVTSLNAAGRPADPRAPHPLAASTVMPCALACRSSICMAVCEAASMSSRQLVVLSETRRLVFASTTELSASSASSATALPADEASVSGCALGSLLSPLTVSTSPAIVAAM